jgi:predicted transposase YdaD
LVFLISLHNLKSKIQNPKLSDEIAFTEEYVDTGTVHRYRVIRLWEQDPAIFLEHPALLPLAPLTKTNSPQALLSQTGERIAKITSNSERQNLLSLTKILAGLRFELNLIHQCLREDDMKESVVYQEILQRGEQRGEQRGILIGEQRGEQRGEQNTAIKWITSLLRHQLGQVDSLVQERIQGLSIQQLEALRDAVFDFQTEHDLLLWLDQQEN